MHYFISLTVLVKNRRLLSSIGLLFTVFGSNTCEGPESHESSERRLASNSFIWRLLGIQTEHRAIDGGEAPLHNPGMPIEVTKGQFHESTLSEFLDPRHPTPARPIALTFNRSSEPLLYWGPVLIDGAELYYRFDASLHPDLVLRTSLDSDIANAAWLPSPGPLADHDFRIGRSTLSIDRVLIHLGVVDQGAKTIATIVLKNKGREALDVLSVSTSCSCTIPEEDVTGLLAPGQQRSIPISVFRGAGGRTFVETVYVEITDPTKPDSVETIPITLFGFVSPKYEVYPGAINFGRVAIGQSPNSEFVVRLPASHENAPEVEIIGDLPIQVVPIREERTDVIHSYFYNASLDVSRLRLPSGPHSGGLHISISRELPPLLVPIKLELLDPVRVTPSTVAWGSVFAGEKLLAELRIESDLMTFKDAAIISIPRDLACSMDVLDGCISARLSGSISAIGAWSEILTLRLRTENGTRDIAVRCTALVSERSVVRNEEEVER